VTNTTHAPAAANPTGAGPYGLPAALFARLWAIGDVCAFAGVGERKARALLALDGAPPRMRMGSARCDRWNPAQVVAWLHGDDWRTPLAAVGMQDPGSRIPDAPVGPLLAAPDVPDDVQRPAAARMRPPGRPFTPPPPPKGRARR
jgi:hypothetical protein